MPFALAWNRFSQSASASRLSHWAVFSFYQFPTITLGSIPCFHPPSPEPTLPYNLNPYSLTAGRLAVGFRWSWKNKGVPWVRRKNVCSYSDFSRFVSLERKCLSIRTLLFLPFGLYSPIALYLQGYRVIFIAIYTYMFLALTYFYYSF